jgi:aspartate-semialdehyde dehydrogenase
MLDTSLTATAHVTEKSLLRGFSYINGKWCAARSGETFAVTDPASGNRLGEVAKLSAEESAAAVDAAQAAFASWSMTLPQERAAILRRWFELIVEHKEDLARIMTLDRASRCRRRAARSTTPLPSSSSTPKRPSARTSRACHLASARCRGGAVARAGRRRGADHAVELPLAMLTRKAGGGAGRGLHRGGAPLGIETPFPRWRWPNWPSARACRPACSTWSPAMRRPSCRHGPEDKPACARCPSPARPRSAACSTPAPRR